MRKAISLATASILTVASLAAASAWHGRATFPYNEDGRFFDDAEGVVYGDGAVVVFAVLTLLLSAAAVAALIWSWRAWRK